MPGETLDWPTFGRFKFEPGDLVFFYASSPVLQMIGKCEIERVDLPFAEADPRNDLRKWPRHHSRIPWMRLRVLQSAPIPFKPLQRGSLYYHTEFKPSPYPKLLHESEREYVMRAFDEAMTYRADLVRNEGGVDPEALARVTRGELLREAVAKVKDGRMEKMEFDAASDGLTVTLSKDDDRLTLGFTGLRRVRWDYERSRCPFTGLRLTREDIFLLINLDGLEAEILADGMRID